MEKQLKSDLSLLTKNHLGEILGYKKSLIAKTQKTKLEDEVINRIKSGMLKPCDIYHKYAVELAMFPKDVEAFLDISTKERKQWTNEEKLPIVDYVIIPRKSNPIIYPIFNRYLIYQIGYEIIHRWRYPNSKIIIVKSA